MIEKIEEAYVKSESERKLEEIEKNLSERDEGKVRVIISSDNCSMKAIMCGSDNKPKIKVNRRKAICKRAHTKSNEKYMSVLNYNRLLNEAYNKLFVSELNEKKCAMITLTTRSNDIDYAYIKKHFENYSKRVKLTFNPYATVQRYEYTKEHSQIHLHYLLFFEDKIPKGLTIDWAKKTWKLGEIVKVSRFRKTLIAIGYISKHNKGDINKKNKGFTLFPRNVHIVQCSKNIKPSNNIIEFRANKEDIEEILKHMKVVNIEKYDSRLNTYEHYFKYCDVSTGEVIKAIKSYDYK